MTRDGQSTDMRTRATEIAAGQRTGRNNSRFHRNTPGLANQRTNYDVHIVYASIDGHGYGGNRHFDAKAAFCGTPLLPAVAFESQRGAEEPWTTCTHDYIQTIIKLHDRTHARVHVKQCGQ